MQRKIRKTARNLCCLVLLSAVLLTACGGATGTQRSSEKNSSPVSGGAVSEGAVSDGAVSERAVSEGAVTEKVAKMEEPTESLYFANSTNFYLEIPKKKQSPDAEREEYEGFAQYTLSGEWKESHELPGYKGLFAVTEEGVYYVAKMDIDNSSQGEKLVRIPIRKGKDGTDRLEREKEEVILTEPYTIHIGYSQGLVTERYIYYVSDIDLSGEGNDVAVKFDRLEKREVSRTEPRKEYPVIAPEDFDMDPYSDEKVSRNDMYKRMEENKDEEEDDEDGPVWWPDEFIQYGDRVYMSVVEGTMGFREYWLTQHIDSTTWERVTELTDSICSVSDEKGCYAIVCYEDEFEFMSYDMFQLISLNADGSQTTLISEKMLENFLLKEKLVDKDALEYHAYPEHYSVYSWKEKIYISFDVDDCPNKWVIISYDRNTGKIALEQELTEQIQANHPERLSKELEKKIEEETLFGEAGTLQLIDKGKAIYSEYDMEGCHYFSYDIETGKKKRLTQKDPELYYLVYILGEVGSTDDFHKLQKS